MKQRVRVPAYRQAGVPRVRNPTTPFPLAGEGRVRGTPMSTPTLILPPQGGGDYIEYFCGSILPAGALAQAGATSGHGAFV